MRYRVSFSYNKIYHIIASPIMQRNLRSQELFEIIRKAKQIYDIHGNITATAQYNNNNSFSIASVFMRSNDAPQLQINHVLVENGTEQAAFNCMLKLLKKLNPKQKETIMTF